MKLYVYCLAEGLDTLAGSTSGIASAPVRLLKLEDFSVLVSDYEGDSVAVTRERALSHAAVVRSILDQTTPLPFRFGTIVSEPGLLNFVKTHRQLLANKLAQIRGCVEMNVRVIYQLAAQSENPEPDGDQTLPAGPGTVFLAEKRRQIFEDERLTSQKADFSDLLGKHLNGLIRDQQISLRPSDTAILATGSHLVQRDHIQQYREKMADARKDRPELHFLVSGPWPPYSFANIALEFKSQFGVS